jgi:hypothetical protein
VILASTLSTAFEVLQEISKDFFHLTSRPSQITVAVDQYQRGVIGRLDVHTIMLLALTFQHDLTSLSPVSSAIETNLDLHDLVYNISRYAHM